MADEAELVEHGPGALLDVPVVPEGGEVLLAGIAGLDGVECRPLGGDTQDLVDPQSGVEDEVLGEIADVAGRPDVSAVGG